MTYTARLDEEYRCWCEKLASISQQHVLQFWPELTEPQRAALLEDLRRLPPMPVLADLVARYVADKPRSCIPQDIQPIKYYPARPDMDRAGTYADALKHGISLIQQGKVAALTVAGGQGTRLGFAGPKGAFPISPVKNKYLFQLFAEFIRGTELRYGVASLGWYIMTSPANDAQTKQFFAENGYFGLQAEQVRFFQQGVMPAFSADGKILLAEKHRIALAPDGHGGTLLALRRSGCLAEMAEAGIEFISYFQVDNPLVRCIDPLFVGLHAATGSQMSSKMVHKNDDFERVGNFVLADGKLTVIEYSDLPDEMATARNPDGSRKFNAGSIAIHVISREFVERLTADEDRFGLPWHRAVKKVSHVDVSSGRRIEPAEPNAIKLETFIFDALPLAANPLVLETLREEEFSPVKNATGRDSAETSRRDMNRRAARWLAQAGAEVPYASDGEPAGTFEISPLFALDAAHLCEKLTEPPRIRPGDTIYIE